jgi:hypothetical protein
MSAGETGRTGQERAGRGSGVPGAEVVAGERCSGLRADLRPPAVRLIDLCVPVADHGRHKRKLRGAAVQEEPGAPRGTARPPVQGPEDRRVSARHGQRLWGRLHGQACLHGCDAR